jgi:hypothetical protein
MENASRAFLDAVRKSMRQIRTVIGATTIDPQLLTAAERLQYEGYLRREETNVAILALSKSGTPIKQIVRQTGHSRKLAGDTRRYIYTIPDMERVARNAVCSHNPITSVSSGLAAKITSGSGPRMGMPSEELT